MLATCSQHKGHLPPAMGPCTVFSHRSQERATPLVLLQLLAKHPDQASQCQARQQPPPGMLHTQLDLIACFEQGNKLGATSSASQVAFSGSSVGQARQEETMGASGGALLSVRIAGWAL